MGGDDGGFHLEVHVILGRVLTDLRALGEQVRRRCRLLPSPGGSSRRPMVARPVRYGRRNKRKTFLGEK